MLLQSHNYARQIKDFEVIEAETLISFWKERKVHPLTGEVYPKYEYEFYRALKKKVKKFFANITYEFTLKLKKEGLPDDEYAERLAAFELEAARIKDTEYTAKIEKRAST